jgi:cbb3-type cytochrome oxidase subunit 3
MDPTVVQTLWTVAALAIFAGIVLWAWSRRAGRGFAEAERAPFDDEAGVERREEGEAR